MICACYFKQIKLQLNKSLVFLPGFFFFYSFENCLLGGGVKNEWYKFIIYGNIFYTKNIESLHTVFILRSSIWKTIKAQSDQAKGSEKASPRILTYSHASISPAVYLRYIVFIVVGDETDATCIKIVLGRRRYLDNVTWRTRVF